MLRSALRAEQRGAAAAALTRACGAPASEQGFSHPLLYDRDARMDTISATIFAARSSRDHPRSSTTIEFTSSSAFCQGFWRRS